MRIEPNTCGRSGKWAYWLKCQDYTVGLRKAETSKWDKAKAMKKLKILRKEVVVLPLS